MEQDYKIITAEAYSEFKEDTNAFFPELNDYFLWHFWNEIEKSANEEENLFDNYHREVGETIVTTLAGTTIFSDNTRLCLLYSDCYPNDALSNELKNLIYALLPIKEAFVIIYMPKDDKFSKREFDYIESCISEYRGIKLLCVVKETIGDLRLEVHVTLLR